MVESANRIKNVEEYYFSKKLAEVRSIDTPEWRVINLGIGSPDQMPSSNAIDALIESAKNPANHGYQNYKGIPQLRDKRKASEMRAEGYRGVSLSALGTPTDP